MSHSTRRSAIAASFTCLALSQRSARADETKESTDKAAAMTASEDSMREHDVLNRLRLVYETAFALPRSGQENLHEVLHGAASLIRSFIADYTACWRRSLRSQSSTVSECCGYDELSTMLSGPMCRHAVALR